MKWSLLHNLLLQYFFFFICLHLESFSFTEDSGWMGGGRSNFSSFTIFNIKHCKMLWFPLVWLLSLCLLASLIPWVVWLYRRTCLCCLNLLAHSTLVTLLASENPYDTCSPQFTLWSIQLNKWKTTQGTVILSW